MRGTVRGLLRRGAVVIAIAALAVVVVPAAASATTAINGTALRSADGLAMPTGTIEIIACANSNPTPTCATRFTAPVDAAGNYSIDLPDGTWGVAPFLVNRGTTYGLNPVNVPLDPTVHYLLVNVSGSGVDVVGNTGTNFQLTAGVVDGTVLRSGIAPPAGSVLVLACPNGGWSATCGGPTAAIAPDGTYSLALSGGSWFVAPVAANGATPVLAPALAAPQGVTVAGNHQTIDFAVAFATLSGTLVHPSTTPYPLGRTAVVLCPSATANLFCAGSVKVAPDSAGAFQVVVPAGTWSAIGFASAKALSPFLSFFDNPSGNVAGASVPLGVLADGGAASAPLVLASARVAGHVLDAATSAPVSGATVTMCVSPCSPLPSTTSDGGGSYALLVPPGSWQPGARVGSPGIGASAVASGFTAADDDDVSRDFLVGGGTISGTVLAPGGGAVGGIAVRTCNSSSQCTGSLENVSAGDGSFAMRHLAPGTYDLVAEPNGGPAQPYGFVRDADVVVADGGVNPGRTLQLVDGHSLAITLRSAPGSPALTSFTGQVSVIADNEGRLGAGGHYSGSPAFGSAGVYTRSGLPAGNNFTVTVSGGGLGTTYVSPVVVNAGSPTTALDVVVAPAASLSGVVRDGVTNLPIANAVVLACPGVQTVPPTAPSAAGITCVSPRPAFANGVGSYSIALGAGVWSIRAYRSSTLGAEGSALVQPTLTARPNTLDIAIGAVNDGDGVDEGTADGNGDGTPDAQQPEVTTLPAGVGGGSVTIDARDPAFALSHVETGPVPGGVPAENFPVGLIGFTVTLPTGVTSVDVDVLLPVGTPMASFFKYQDAAWFDFTSHTTTSGNTVTLHLVDNDVGDADGTAGVIRDPFAPGGYTFGGFQSPVRVGVNAPKAGQAIPVKWTLTLADGTPVSAQSSVAGVRSRVCSDTTSDGVPVDTSGASGLQYKGGGQWQFNWKSDKAWKGQCRTFLLQLADGTVHTTDFQFK